MPQDSENFKGPHSLSKSEKNTLMAFHGKTKSDLVVTVRNGKRQCFIKENGDNKSYSGTNFKKDLNFESTHCDSSVQVTDGRYASTYQISHCHVSPTSPSEELPEFPLQQKLLNSGDSHFKVGTDRKNVPRSSEPLRRDNPNAIEIMPRLKHSTDEFLSSLRKYSKPSLNRNLEITEKINGGKHAKNPLIKHAPSSANKTDEPLALEERSQCNNFISKGEAQKCEISKWLRQDQAKHGTKPSFTTAIDVRELQKSTRKDKESLRSVTLPNIAYSIDPSFFVQEEIEADSGDTISPELKANNIQILQDMQFIKQNRKETEIQTEINTVSDANKITIVKNGLEMLEPQHFNNHTGYNYKTSNIVTAKENKCFNVNLDIPNYQQVFPESSDVNSNSNDEFLKDSIKRWVHMILIETGRCTDQDELKFVFQYLLKYLKILKNYNHFILNSKSQYTLNTIPCVNNDDLLSTIVSDENDNNNMTMVIERLTDMLMEKIRLIYKQKYTVHNNTIKRNLKIKEILPTLGDDFYKEINFRKGLFNVDLYPEMEKKIVKESGSNNTSASLSEIQTAIQDWLDLLDLPQVLQNYKNIAIVSLASEIKKRIDRQNYIQLRSPSYIVSDEIELEYLHYLIFKWNNKYFPKQRIEMLRNIKTLFYSIRKLNSENDVNRKSFDKTNPINVVAYPVLIQDKFYSENQNNIKCQETHFHKMYSTNPISLVRNSPNQKVKCLQSLSNDKNVFFEHDPYEEYDQFVKLWSQEITKDLFTPQEANVAENAALGIYNGVWKAIVKLNYKESIHHEYYEDFLEKEIDELIDCLPQTPQLRSIRHVLKVRLVEKTMITLKYICKDRVTSLKNELILKIQDYLGALKFDVDSFKSINPCLAKVAEMYILWTKYSNENQEIARAYKRKVSTEIGKIYHILKQKYQNELDTLNIEMFYEKCVNELREINISNDTLLEDADKVLLGQEIDQWFFDLSLTSEDVFEDEDHKKIMKDILVALVKETENNIGMNDDDKKSKLHSDIRNILKTNIIKEENLNTQNTNIDFLASELINRIDNMRQLCPRNIQLSIVPNENSLSFAERITKYKLGLHENQHNTLANNTLKHMSDDTAANSTLNAYKEPSTSVIKNNNIKWHTLHENTIHSDNSENSMKTAIDLEVPHANSNFKIDHQTPEPEKKSKKCSCKISTCSLRNQLYIYDEENAIPINRFNDNSKIVLKVLKPHYECEDTLKDISENSIGVSKRERQTDLNLIDKSNKIPFSNGRENSRDIGVNVLLNDGNCKVGALEPNSDVPDSKGCQCSHRFQNYKSVFHSQTENGEHPAFIPVLYPYLYFI